MAACVLYDCSPHINYSTGPSDQETAPTRVSQITPGILSKFIVLISGIQAHTDYWYVDVWSSNFTWGGEAPPGEGEFVVIPPGQLLLLDQSTPVLKMLLIQGK